MIKRFSLLFSLLLSSLFTHTQGNLSAISIEWKSSYTFQKELSSVSIPNCTSCQLLNEVPFYSQKIAGILTNKQAKITIQSVETSAVSKEDLNYLSPFKYSLPTHPKFEINLTKEKGQYTAYLSGIPFVVEDGIIKKINRFQYTIQYMDWPLKAKNYVATSVLENPNKKWYRIAINKDGFYKIDKAFLESIGVNTTQLNPQHINIYGNSNGRLSIKNSDERPDDLIKNPIYVEGEADQSFDDEDYILFHAFGSSKWSYQGDSYRRDTNPYSQFAYYFICISSEEVPLRISSVSESATPNATITSYDYSLIHEEDLVNLVKGGQRFYGEKFDTELSRNFSFLTPNLIGDATAIVSYATAKVNGTGTISIKVNGQTSNSNTLPTSSEDGYTRKENSFTFSPASTTNLTLTVDKSHPSTVVYLDKIEIIAQRQLKYTGGTMYFRTKENLGNSNVNKYVIAGATNEMQVWDLTNRNHPVKIEGQFSNGNFTFVSSANVIKEFVAFTPSTTFTPTFVEQVQNQDLHGLGFADILIVTAPDFLSQANRLAELHRNDGSTVHVATVQQVYNEFSGGQKDPTAIRQFAKMFYDRANGANFNEPKNLILFGNGNYDPRGIIFPLEEDHVPTFQSENSETPISAFTSDDFFGILDDEEAFSANDKMDIGVGRLLVSNQEDANIILNKIKRYISNYHNAESTFGDWRLKYTLIADDEDTFLTNDTEPVYYRVKASNPEMNATKIYADAYPQQITSGGIRLPEMEDDINRAVENGNLVIAYVGHGGVKGAGQERFIDRNQISNWENPDMLNLFVSATCDFTRADDPEVNSAGEVMLLNPNGGAIALMSTNRSIYYTVNTQVDSSFFSVAFNRDENHQPLTFGEIFRQTKNKAGASDNKRSFMLIGDPALRLALPNLKVITDSINGIEVSGGVLDTLKALTKITISGYIADQNNQLLENYNGILTPSIFDKEKLNKTLGHKAGETSVLDFYTQENILYKGNITIKDGRFKFTFIVPKDINYQFGKGKISYYAHNGVIDAYGFDTSIVVGGINPNSMNDDLPPNITAYLNDSTFIDGGITDENPIFIALLSDDVGINAVGNGIGHDISLVLDGNEANPIILNNYYISDLDSYQSGSIRYQLKNLEEGLHQLKLKAWDVNNNSAVAYVNFVVVKSNEFEIDNVMNYPNPVTDQTTFSFEHNQPNEHLSVEIIISSASGTIAKTIQQEIIPSGYRSADIQWNGTGDSGTKLSNGMYLYTIIVTNSEGKTAKKNGKLILM